MHHSFLACKTINLTIFESGEMQLLELGSAKGLAPCLIGNFSVACNAARKIP